MTREPGNLIIGIMAWIVAAGMIYAMTGWRQHVENESRRLAVELYLNQHNCICDPRSADATPRKRFRVDR